MTFENSNNSQLASAEPAGNSNIVAGAEFLLSLPFAENARVAASSITVNGETAPVAATQLDTATPAAWLSMTDSGTLSVDRLVDGQVLGSLTYTAVTNDPLQDQVSITAPQNLACLLYTSPSPRDS